MWSWILTCEQSMRTISIFCNTHFFDIFRSCDLSLTPRLMPIHGRILVLLISQQKIPSSYRRGTLNYRKYEPQQVRSYLCEVNHWRGNLRILPEIKNLVGFQQLYRAYRFLVPFQIKIAHSLYHKHLQNVHLELSRFPLLVLYQQVSFFRFLSMRCSSKAICEIPNHSRPLDDFRWRPRSVHHFHLFPTS